MEQKIKVIVDYIYRKKGVVINAIPPRNDREYALMVCFIIIFYYLCRN